MIPSALLCIALALALSTPALARCVPCRHRNSEAKREFKIETGHPHGLARSRRPWSAAATTA
jgi:hypothetical protein